MGVSYSNDILDFTCEHVAVTQLLLRSKCQSQGMVQSLNYNVQPPLPLSCCIDKRSSLILELDQGICINHPTCTSDTSPTGRVVYEGPFLGTSDSDWQSTKLSYSMSKVNTTTATMGPWYLCITYNSHNSLLVRQTSAWNFPPATSKSRLN